MQNSSLVPPAFRFGPFEVSPQSGELYKKGMKIRLHGQPIEILLLLLEQPGEVITRENLQKKLWPGDTFVDFEQGLNNAIKRLRAALGDSAESPLFIETLPRRGYRLIAPVERSIRRSMGSAQAVDSIAVLPFVNLSPETGQEYFADGMTEALIAELARISCLRVISPTSAMRYKNRQKSLPEIAADLGAEFIVEGSVLRSDDRIRITVELIEAASESHLWAESYERGLRDILVLQSELARSIANQVHVKLTPEDHRRFRSAHQVDPEAYDTVLRGRATLEYATQERQIRQAIDLFQKAVDRDSTYAQAWAGLGEAWWMLAATGLEFVAPGNVRGKAIAAAEKAFRTRRESA